MLSTPNSVFQISPGHQSRAAGPSHPWDFSYPTQQTLHSSISAPNTSRAPPVAAVTTSAGMGSLEEDPYWKRACVQPKISPSPLSASVPSLQLKFQTNQTCGLTKPQDPALLSVVKRLASHPEYRRLIENYKRNSLPSRVGYISNKHLLNSLRAIQFPLKKAEFNLLLKEFRAIGLPDTFHFQRMVDLAQEMS